jgi:8-oxo-dGTP pyrophosphatase MutT (NUDIX family)
VIERRVVSVLLVDRQGQILMQQRDANARTSPNQWSLPGGRIEPHETPVEAARRELQEETGLSIPDLIAFGVYHRPAVERRTATVEIHAFCAATRAVDDDMVLGEGQAVRFVPPDDALRLDLDVTAAVLLPAFLASPLYTALHPAG